MSPHEATGIVDFFNETGGYGFIESDQVDEDVFFHMDDIGDLDLTEGTEVAFDIEHADKGPRATNMTRNSDAETITDDTGTDRRTTNTEIDNLSAETPEATGIVNFFNETGGYGFIESDQVDQDVFFHMEDIGGPALTEGTEVALEIEQAEKGPRAVNVIRNPDTEAISDDTSTDRQTNNTELYNPDAESGQSDTQVYTGSTDAGRTSECPDCSRRLPENQQVNFCPECGIQLSTSTSACCPSCDSNISEYGDVAFCPDCGFDLSG